MSALSSNDIDSLTTRLFNIENGCKPGLPAPDSQTMVQLLREARVTIENLYRRSTDAEAKLEESVLRLETEKKKDGVWK